MAQLSGRYAAALFDLAIESGDLAGYREQALLMRDALEDDDCKRIIEHPHITRAQKKQFVDELFAGKVSDDLMGFLYMGIDRGREKFLAPGLSAFVARVDEFSGRAQATVTCAASLEKSQTLALEALLSKKTGKQVSVGAQIVDPSVIGGICIQMDGYFLDLTVKKKLSDLKASLQRSTAHDSQA